MIQIANLYNTYAFDGEKKVFLGEVDWIGTKNNAVGITFIVIGYVVLLREEVSLSIAVLVPTCFMDAVVSVFVFVPAVVVGSDADGCLFVRSQCGVLVHSELVGVACEHTQASTNRGALQLE